MIRGLARPKENILKIEGQILYWNSKKRYEYKVEGEILKIMVECYETDNTQWSYWKLEQLKDLEKMFIFEEY